MTFPKQFIECILIFRVLTEFESIYNNYMYECANVLIRVSIIPTNRKMQQCQGHGTRAIPGEIANVPQHAEVLIGRPGIQTNRKIQQCQGHGSREVLSEIANVPQQAEILIQKSIIPTKRKTQQCQGDGTHEVPSDIANVPQHAEVLIWRPGIPTNRKKQKCQGDSLRRIYSAPNGKMHNRKVHSNVEDAHRHANVCIDLQKPPLTTNSYISLLSEKVFPQKQNAESHRKMMSGTKNPQKQNARSRRKKKSFTMELVARHPDANLILPYERSNTFTSNGWPQEPGTWWPRLLPEAGFYYRGHDLEVHKVNEVPAEAHARLNRNCEHVVSNGFIPNPNVPEDFQKDDKQAGNSETCTTLTNVGIPAISKNNSLKTTDTPNAVNGYSCEQRNLTDIAATDSAFNAVNGYSCEQTNRIDIVATTNTSNAISSYSREQRNLIDIVATTNAFNAISGYSREQRNLTDIAEIDNTANAISGYSREQRSLTDIAATANASNAITPEMSDRHQSSIMSPGSTPKNKNNSIGSKNGYRIETLNNLAKSNTSNQILQKETTDSNNSALSQINTSSRKEPSFDGNVGNGNWSLSQDSILKDNNMSIDVRNRERNHMINNFNYSIDIAQVDSSNGMNSQLTQDGLQSYQPEFRYPQHQTLTTRKSSYDKWQFGHKQSPDVLSKAGYFYTGKLIIITGSLQLNAFLCNCLFRNCIFLM